jgi:succinate dehydrogenase/fumarate reductase cytochrome b subunit
MKARDYYLARGGTLLALMLGIPILMAIKGEQPDRKGLLAFLLFDGFLAALLIHSIWRLRTLPAEARMRPRGPSHEVVHAAAAAGSRRLPLATLLGGIAGLVLNVWLYGQGRYKLLALIVSPALFLFGLGGVIYPPVFYAIRRDLGEQPGSARAIAYFLMIVGLVLGGVSVWWVLYRR